MPSTHRLAAIMFTDIAGYTAMMQQNESAALRYVQLHEKVLERHISQYGGKIHQSLR